MSQYVLILVDSPKLANEITQSCLCTRDTDTLVQAVSVGQQMVGLRHRETRPTVIIDMITDRSAPNFGLWWENCVIPNARKAKMVKGGGIDGD